MYKFYLSLFISVLFNHSIAQQQMGMFMAYGQETKYLSTQNYAVHQTKNGYLWIGTQNGLVRFDGKYYKNYFADYTNNNSPTDNIIVDIVEDKKGDLWFCGFAYGLTKYNERTEQFKKYKKPTRDNFQFYGINDGHKDRDGNLWFATSGRGLANYHYEKDSFELFYPEPDKCKDGSKRGENYVTGICEDKNEKNILWISTYVGFYAFDKITKKFTYYPSGIKVSYATDINFTSCEADNSGNIWLGTWDEGLVCFNTLNKKFIHEKRKPIPRIVNHVKLVADSLLFTACFSDGLYQLNLKNQAYTNITPPQNSIGSEFKKSSIQKISITADAGIFIGGSRYIYQYHPAFTRLRKNVFYQDLGTTDYISLNSLVWDADKKYYWLATSYGNGVYTLKENETLAKKVQVNEIATSPSKIYTGLAKDAKKRIWVINYYNGLYVWNDLKKAFEKPAPGSTPLPDSILNNCRSMQTDKPGNIWLLSGHQFIFYNVIQNKIETYPINWSENYKGPKSYAPALIRMDPAGNPWLLTQHGLFVTDVSKKKVSHIYTMGSSETKLPFSSIESGVFNKYNNFWVTSGNTLQVYDWKLDSVLSHHTINSGLPSMFVSDVNADKKGRIWASTLSGLALFDPAKKIWRTYDRYDGLEKDYLDGTIFITENEKIAIDQQIGFLLKDLKEMGSSPDSPLLRFTSITINDKIYTDTLAPAYCKALNLPYDKNNISLEFAAMDWLYPFKTNYLLRIEGIPSMNTFHSVKDNKLNLTGLAPGNYTVYIMALSGSGVWSNTISLPITINKPFWLSYWFILLCVLMISLAIYKLYKYRINQLHKLHRMRNNISRNLHDDIGSSLSNINILTELVKRNPGNTAKSGEYLNKMSEDIQDISESLSDIVWNINPKYDDIQNLLVRMKRYAADMMDGKNISYKFSFPEETKIETLEMDKRRDFYFIFKEAINNLVKHSEATHAEVSIGINQQILILHITDNGKGYDLKTIPLGNGLQNMQHRANLLHAKLDIDTQPGKGCTVMLKMPLA